ncbi:MAG: LamG domain-containing protein, partial [Firmicutes bacterium]|nr:LamG domain-containing protein [Bacillota bacterium]
MKKVLISLMCIIMVVCFMPTVAMATGGSDLTDLTVAENWAQDRTEPAAWSIADGKISLTVKESPAADDWYAYQGRKANTGYPVTKFWSEEHTFDITEDMLNTQNINVALWIQVDKTGEGTVDSQNNCVDWSIIQFINKAEGAKWQTWDATNTGGWKDANVSTPVVGTHNLKTTFSNGKIRQYIDGEKVNEYVITKDETNVTETAPASVIAQARSYGSPFTVSIGVPQLSSNVKEVATAEELNIAISEAAAGDTIKLMNDITVTNDSTDVNSSVITINKNITFDGNGKTITASTDNWTQAKNTENEDVPTRHLIGIQNGTNVTVKDLTIVGNAKTKHGINVWTDYNNAEATKAEVTLNNVTIKNCGTAGLVVVNSKVTATNLTTSGNVWGAVNVDKGTPSFTLVSGNLAEDAKVWSELTGAALNGIKLPTNWKVVKEEGGKTFYAYVAPIYVPPTTPTTPTDNVTNSGTAGTDNATTSADLSGSTSTSNGTTSATVDKTTADKIVDKAVANKSEEIVIDVTANSTTVASSTTTAQVTIPTETLGAIAEKTEADVTIKTDVAEVKLDNAAAAAVAEQAEGDTVQIIAEKVKEDAAEVHFELKVVRSDGKVISDFKGGNVAVTVALPKAMADKKVVCVYIDDNGHMSKVEGQKNADGTYTFNTGHFSSYAIMAEEEADAAIAAQKEAIKNIKIKLTSKQVKTKAGK